MEENSSQSRRVIVLGGCNGAGKTTAAKSLLAETLGVLTFVNADTIAQGLSGFDPTSAAAAWLQMLKQTGYAVHLFYFWLNSADLAVERVAMRVRNGGHSIPEATIRQRYTRSVRNFLTLYRPLADGW